MKQIWFNDTARSAVIRYDDVGDSASWTGLHLAALAHQYNVTNNSTVLKEIDKSLDAVSLLSTCSGKPGYIVRFAGPASDPAYKKYYPGYGNGAFNCTIPPYHDYIWLGFSSRDMYFGIAFGLANVLRMLHTDSAQSIIQRTKNITETIVDDLVKYDFWIISPKKQPTNPDPMFLATWKLLALTVNPVKYQHLLKTYKEYFWSAYYTEMTISTKTHNAYFGNELLVEGLYVLSTFEIDVQRREALFNKFTVLAVNHSDHLQPGFAAFYLSAFPDTKYSNIPAGVLQGGLLDYPSTPWEHHVDQTNNPKYMPHHDSDHSECALMIRDRPPDVYMWQREPTALKGGTSECCLQNAHLDLTLPYWMGRSAGYIGTPN
ncbi:uncharacterized protein [Dysidea avara]|uniref:uncharacterized protein isoform X2 n=1 Tax=Dysidea avara TaxID=196820 RepID=UPI0033251FFB